MAEKSDPSVSQLRKGVLELVVLGLLSGGELYGSQIVERLEHRPGLAISVGTVYPLLARLRKAGLIESSWQESPVGPPRKYYSLTKLGSSELALMTTAWMGIRADVDGILAEVPDVR